MRRKLHYSPAEWDALPWWQQDMFLDGLREELSDDENGHDYGPETDGDDNEDAFDTAFAGARHRVAAPA